MLLLSLSLNLAYAALVGFDVWLTKRRVAQHGPEIELNKLVRKLAVKFPKWGIPLGVVAPSLAVLVAANFVDVAALAFLTGMRTDLFLSQLWSLLRESPSSR